MAEQELKACHRCGGKATLVSRIVDEKGPIWHGECENEWRHCGGDSDQAKAARLWNTRPIEDALTARLSAAEAEVERLLKRNGELVDWMYGHWSGDVQAHVLECLSEEEQEAAAARLASIKETARMLFASGRVVLVNSAFDQAEHFEETFERRYGGKP